MESFEHLFSIVDQSHAYDVSRGLQKVDATWQFVKALVYVRKSTCSIDVVFQRSNYEWYIPRGIFKTAWLEKHLKEIPAVVVLFFDLDWDDPDFKEKQMECAKRLGTLRYCI